MADEHAIARYRRWYRKLLRFYSRPYRERFAEGMEQTFQDLCRERCKTGQGLSALVLWMFVETSAGIIRDNVRVVIMQNITRRLIVWAIVVAAVLMIPLLGKWPWTGGDFVFGAVVLFGSALVYELVARKGGTTAYRAAVGIACATGLILVWINAAVGIIGDGPVNLMYLGVLTIGFIGALIARFEPRGMALVLFATAMTQALVPVIALVVWMPDFSPGVVPVFVLNAFFVTLWAVSALLFRHAAGPTVITQSDFSPRDTKG